MTPSIMRHQAQCSCSGQWLCRVQWKQWEAGMMLIMWLEMGDNWTPAFICFADKDDVKDVLTAYDVSKPNCKN